MSTDRIVRRVTDFKAQREETYHYWRSRTIAERIEAVAELVRDAYFAKGVDVEKRAPDKTIVRVERPGWKAVG
jgi:hypothetical protein